MPDAEKLLYENDYRTFPVVESEEDPLLLGSIGRDGIENALGARSCCDVLVRGADLIYS